MQNLITTYTIKTHYQFTRTLDVPVTCMWTLKC